MSAPTGNQFWKARSSHGRKPTFATPKSLWDACLEYFQWVEDNPLKEDVLTTYQGSSKHEEITKMRAMTITGLCIFLDIDSSTWRLWSEGKLDNKDYLTVTTRVAEVIRTQKFEGAAGGFLNPNIIARDLGLAEKVESQHSGPNGGPIQTIDAKKLTKAQLEALASIRLPADSK